MQTQPQQLLALVLDGERYYVSLEGVAEVVEHDGVTPLPNSPPEVLGVTDLRGDTMRVLDPRAVLGLDGEPGGDRIVVTRPDDAPVGWLVDAVDDVVEADDVEADDVGVDDVEVADEGDAPPLVDLAARAEERAGDAVPAPVAGGSTQLLEFGLEDGRYAVPLDVVDGIEDAGGLEPLDDGPPGAVGELPGVAPPVLVACPKTVYELPGEPTGDRVVVLDRETDDRRVGWLVDEVFDVFEPRAGAVEPPGPDVDGVDAVVHLADRFVMWLQPGTGP